MSLLSIVALGFFLGMRHATDADHVVAVSTIVSRARSLRAAALVGALWGIGHSFAVGLAGGAIVLWRVSLSPRLGLSMEMAVAVMLIVLGTANVSGAARGLHRAAHHPSPAEEGDHGRWHRLAPVRPLAVGIVHGLAGSAAVALLVLATIERSRWALIYLGVFGAGTVAGMMALTVMMAAPLRAASKRWGAFDRWMGRATGLASLLLGLALAYRIGIVDGLFTAAPQWTPK